MYNAIPCSTWHIINQSEKPCEFIHIWALVIILIYIIVSRITTEFDATITVTKLIIKNSAITLITKTLKENVEIQILESKTKFNR